MPLYITLYNLTDQGVKDIKNVAERFKGGVKAFEAMGGKLIGFYVTMGEYDYVSIGEAPSDEVLTNSALKIASAGNVRTETMKVYVEAKYRDTIAKL